MSLPHHKADAADPQAPTLATRPPGPAKADGQASARLAHELANLLDGGLRNVSLALSSLRDAERAGSPDGGIDDVVQRLDTASLAMKQMATLLRCWLMPGPAALDMGSDGGTLGQAIQHAVRLFAGAAEPHGVQVLGRCAVAAAALPVGPVFPVIINAVRNSIEAMRTDAGVLSEPRPLIEVSAALEGDHVCVRVTDNGPGIAPELLDESGRFRFGATTKPSGHGLGLTLARDLAEALDGELTVSNRSSRGAAVTLCFPVAGIKRIMNTDPPECSQAPQAPVPPDASERQA